MDRYSFCQQKHNLHCRVYATEAVSTQIYRPLTLRRIQSEFRTLLKLWRQSLAVRDTLGWPQPGRPSLQSITLSTGPGQPCLQVLTFINKAMPARPLSLTSTTCSGQTPEINMRRCQIASHATGECVTSPQPSPKPKAKSLAQPKAKSVATGAKERICDKISAKLFGNPYDILRQAKPCHAGCE